MSQSRRPVLGLMVGDDLRLAVQVVDHHAGRLIDVFGRQVGSPVDALYTRNVTVRLLWIFGRHVRIRPEKLTGQQNIDT